MQLSDVHAVVIAYPLFSLSRIGWIPLGRGTCGPSPLFIFWDLVQTMDSNGELCNPCTSCGYVSNGPLVTAGMGHEGDIAFLWWCRPSYAGLAVCVGGIALLGSPAAM